MDLRVINGKYYEVLQHHNFSEVIDLNDVYTNTWVRFNTVKNVAKASCYRVDETTHYIVRKISIEIPYVNLAGATLEIIASHLTTLDLIQSWTDWLERGSAVTTGGLEDIFPQEMINLNLKSLPQSLEIDYGKYPVEIETNNDDDNKVSFYIVPQSTYSIDMSIIFEGFYAKFIRELTRIEMEQFILAGGLS